MGLLAEADEQARTFISSVEKDETLAKVTSEGSEVADRRAKALEQVAKMKAALPELEALQKKYAE